jgi:hypothetical protein
MLESQAGTAISSSFIPSTMSPDLTLQIFCDQINIFGAFWQINQKKSRQFHLKNRRERILNVN